MDDEMFFVISTERCRPGEPVFWNQSKWGYTAKLSEAGRFTKDEAYDICSASNYEDLPIPCEAVRLGE